MALATRRTAPSLDASTGMYAGQITGLIAGEALDACAACYIKGADGKVYQSNGTSSNEAAGFDGMSPRAAAAGEPVTLYHIGARFGYGSALTPGALLYVAATAGRLDTAATTGGDTPVARCVDATDIEIIVAYAR